ncbi:MAG: transporter suffix domain-containing protein [Bacteroidales bacterium]|nr:transporter suffix domain-containing protein [Bacteroidales bacterium]
MAGFGGFGQKNWKFKLGVVLMILSVPVFLGLVLIPFLDFDNKVKITLTTVTLIVAELMFWSGGLLLGKELFSKYKSYFNPKNWFPKKAEEVE